MVDFSRIINAVGTIVFFSFPYISWGLTTTKTARSLRIQHIHRPFANYHSGASSAPTSASRWVTMRDASASYWFHVGDSVKVVDDVIKSGTSLLGRQGKVIETWEKCDVDPTCCCAEQVDIGMAVRVEFQGTEQDAAAPDSSFYHYFAESELVAIPKEDDIN